MKNHSFKKLVYFDEFFKVENSSALFFIIVKFPYNARSDWLNQRTLSENKVQLHDIKLAFKFLVRNFDKLDPN